MAPVSNPDKDLESPGGGESLFGDVFGLNYIEGLQRNVG